ncbi:hypothetical protein H0H93_007879 [Arthromyces matolae]|nr:hypothetical protein H0H93_007879 [Arthromyces matolae]
MPQTNKNVLPTGVTLVVFTMTSYHLFHSKRTLGWKLKWFSYVTVLFGLALVNLAMNIWITSTVFAVLFTIQAALPQSSLWAQKTVDFSLPYFAIVMALNAFLTILLVGRLLYMRRKIASLLGNEHGRMYAHISTTLLESAVPYGLVSFVFIVLYGARNTAANLFIPFLAQLAAISPTLIILRVAKGFDMTNKTLTKETQSTMAFHVASRVTGSTTADGTEHSKEASMVMFQTKSSSQIRSKERDIVDIAV